MVDFDPSEPAILHDSRTDCIVTWTGEDIAAYREEAIARPDGTVEWSGYKMSDKAETPRGTRPDCLENVAGWQQASTWGAPRLP
jgi:hypothetical protein